MEDPLQVHLEAYPVDVQITFRRETKRHTAVLRGRWDADLTKLKRVPGPVCARIRPRKGRYVWPTEQLRACMEGTEGQASWLQDSHGNVEISTYIFAVQLFELVLTILSGQSATKITSPSECESLRLMVTPLGSLV